MTDFELFRSLFVAWALALPVSWTARCLSSPSGAGVDISCIMIECAVIYTIAAILAYILGGVLGAYV